MEACAKDMCTDSRNASTDSSDLGSSQLEASMLAVGASGRRTNQPAVGGSESVATSRRCSVPVEGNLIQRTSAIAEVANYTIRSGAEYPGAAGLHVVFRSWFQKKEIVVNERSGAATSTSTDEYFSFASP